MFNTVKFPEFELINDEVYVLDSQNKDDDQLEKRGSKLLDRNSMDISDYKIRMKEGKYGLYVR